MDEHLRAEVVRLGEAYPVARSALMPAFHAVQSAEGHVSEDACREIAMLLGVDPPYAYGVLTFYTLYRTAPAGQFVLQACRTLSCEMAGSDALVEHLATRLGIRPGQTTQDGRFTLRTCECLASCGSGPALLVNDELHEHMTPQRADELLAELRVRMAV
jgi:NADH-quinone oxidoreductase subunit E